MDLPVDLKQLAVGDTSFNLDFLVGTVTTEQKWSQTRVWGSGGGGSVGRHGGTISPVRIHSAVDLKQETWLALPDGSPYCVQITNFNVQALDGHPLLVVTASPAGEKGHAVMVVGNLMTGMRFDNPSLSTWLVQQYAAPFLWRIFWSLVVPGLALWGLFTIGAYFSGAWRACWASPSATRSRIRSLIVVRAYSGSTRSRSTNGSSNR